MLNGIFAAVVLGSVLFAAFTGRMDALSAALFDTVKSAVEIALGLVGALAFFLGLTRIASDAGLLRSLARALSPILVRIFPDVPRDHPALSAMVLNIASNLLGLGNAATPFGIKAMIELDRLNPVKGTASNAMVTFLAINTAGLAILPTTILALRSEAGSRDPAGILPATWAAGLVGTLVAVVAALLLARLKHFRAAPASVAAGEPASATVDAVPVEVPSPAWSAGRTLVAGAFGVALLAALVRHVWLHGAVGAMRDLISGWAIPVLVAAVVATGWAKGVAVYDALVAGAKEGFDVALRILPYLVAVLAMVALFRASGALTLIAGWVGPVTALVGMPAEVLPVALLRPFSGSGAFGVLSELVRTHGPDSPTGFIACAVHGSTETTFYVLAVYGGAVGLRRMRHALPACLLADVAAVLTAIWVAARLVPGP